MYDTHLGQRIQVQDYREGYVRWCAICGDGDDGHTMEHYDHPFFPEPKEPIPCFGCGGEADPDYHYSVGLTRVAHAVYCSRECAWKHDPSKWEDLLP